MSLCMLTSQVSLSRMKAASLPSPIHSQSMSSQGLAFLLLALGHSLCTSLTLTPLLMQPLSVHPRALTPPPFDNKQSFQAHPHQLKILNLMSKIVPHSGDWLLLIFMWERRKYEACPIKGHEKKKAWTVIEETHSTQGARSLLHQIQLIKP